VIGVLVALVLLVKRLSNIEISYEKVDMTRVGTTDDTLVKRFSHATVVYISGAMIFANTKEIENIPCHIKSDCNTVIFSMRGASTLDISAAQELLEVIRGLKKQEIDVFLCGVPNVTMNVIERSGIAELLGEENFYWSVDRALSLDKSCPQKQMAS
jgi:SulP family sulfate permease